MDTITATSAVARVLVVDGDLAAPAGWNRIVQRGGLLGERLTHAYTDCVVPGRASLLVGMDTPQLNPNLLNLATRRLSQDGTDAVLGLAADGGWWGLGLRDPRHAQVLRDVPMSTAQTGALTLAALLARGLQVAALPVLRDVDTAADAREVAALCPPDSRFAVTMTELS